MNRSIISVSDLCRKEEPLAQGMKSYFSTGFKPFNVKDKRPIGLAFFEPSTRTKLSFTRAAMSLGLQVLDLPPASASSLTKGETELDTIRNMVQLDLQAIVIRTGNPDLFDRLTAEFPEFRFINAGAGAFGEHPTQALGDFITLKDRMTIDTVKWQDQMPKIAIVGDIARSRVARSNVKLLRHLGFEVVLGAPDFLLPDPTGAYEGVGVASSLEEALEGTYAVMALRIQKERASTPHNPAREALFQEYVKHWQIKEEHLDGPDAPYLMHPGPVNYGVEITEGAAKHPRSLIMDQVKFGLQGRKDLLLYGAQ